MSAWLLLLIAILFELAGTICMKFSNGFSNIYASIMVFVFYGMCFVFLIFALKTIDLSIAYAIWSGLGTMLITIFGIFYFNEPATPLKILAVALIIIGVVILQMSDKLT